MNINAKNGKETIQLNQSERKALESTAATLATLARFDTSLQAAADGLSGAIGRVESDGTYTVSPATTEG